MWNTKTRSIWYHWCEIAFGDFLNHFPIVIFTAAIWFLLYTKSRLATTKNLPPGPRGLPVIGYLPFIRTNSRHRQFAELAKIYGPIYKLWLGNKPLVVITSPSLVKQVVRDQDLAFANRSPIAAATVLSYGGNGLIFSSYGPDWKKLRKIFVTQMLSNSVLDSLYHLRRKEVRNCVREVYGKIGTPIDVNDLAFSTSINSIFGMLWGGDGIVGGVDRGEIRRSAAKAFGLIGKTNVSDIYPGLARFDLQGIEKETKEAVGPLEWMVEYAIGQRKKTMEEEKAKPPPDIQRRKDFLQFLLDLHENEHTQTPITINQLKALLTVYIYVSFSLSYGWLRNIPFKFSGVDLGTIIAVRLSSRVKA